MILSWVMSVKLFRENMELWVKIQVNTIRDLAHKVRKDNEIIEKNNASWSVA